VPTPTSQPTNTPTPLPTATAPPDIWATIQALPTAIPVDVDNDGDAGLPCRWAETTGSSAQLQCQDGSGRVWLLSVNIATTCPMNEVLVEPYPRALVSVPQRFALIPREWNPSADGVWSPPQNVYSMDGVTDWSGQPLQAGLVRNVQFGLRSQRLAFGSRWLGALVPNVNWTYSTGSANGEALVQQGITSTYSFAAASYVGPDISTSAQANKGRAFNFTAKAPSTAYTLPAYPVVIKSYCGFWQSIKLEESRRYWHPFSECIPVRRDDDGNPSIPVGFSTEGCPSDQMSYGEWRYYWEPITLQAWTPINMQRFGSPSPYVGFTRATAHGVFNNAVWIEPTGRGLWVPVVEVQTVQQ
jgi:hypothetical protein